MKVYCVSLTNTLTSDEVFTVRSLNGDPAGNKNKCWTQDSIAEVKVSEAIIWQIQAKMHTKVTTVFNANGALM